jgi:capsular polysaccharide export protein
MLAERAARQLGLPLWRLEDGFLRSYGTGERFPGLSLVVDDLGIYYDSTRISALENVLVCDDTLLAEQADLIESAHGLIKKYALSKYNHGVDIPLNALRDNDLQRVLVIDQTAGDMSVALGAADAQSFADMLAAALADNPRATIYVKTHPEVTSGRKGGYLTHIQDDARVVMLRDAVNPFNLIERMDKVYVVSSTMGFEALLVGKPVVCFGVPWYAGWGVTDDRVQDSPAWARRTKKRSVDELFAAAYLHYTRYLNPFTHEVGTILDVINWLVLQKNMVKNQFKRVI